jgi:hypothetical protein
MDQGGRHSEFSSDRSKTKGCSSSLKRLAVATNVTRGCLGLRDSEQEEMVGYSLPTGLSRRRMLRRDRPT